jgi:hypothetical protein
MVDGVNASVQHPGVQQAMQGVEVCVEEQHVREHLAREDEARRSLGVDAECAPQDEERRGSPGRGHEGECHDRMTKIVLHRPSLLRMRHVRSKTARALDRTRGAT